MRKTITLLIMFFLVFFGYSQTKEQDSLLIQLAYQNQDTIKIETSLNLIKSLYNAEDYDRALKYIFATVRLHW